MTTSGKTISPEVVQTVLSRSPRWCKNQRRLLGRISLLAGNAVWERRRQAYVELFHAGQFHLLRIEFSPSFDDPWWKLQYKLYIIIHPYRWSENESEMRSTKFIYATQQLITERC